VTNPSLDVDIRRQLGTFTLDTAFSAEQGVLALFGPSGAGKTTVLNAIAGLTRPDSGSIRLAGRTLFSRNGGGDDVDVPARLRRVGYVMQDYALFPHLTALGNVAYPLRRDPDGDRTAAKLLGRVGMDRFLDVLPARLSGGQQQRVAIARALALRTPVLLLDEPFAALDAAVREHLQHDLRGLQQELGLVVLLVTHRIDDVFALGDSIAVIDEGRILQTGPVRDVFHAPASRHVAALLGIRNVIEADVVESGADAVLDWQGLRLRTSLVLEPGEQRLAVFIRPEDVKVVYPDRPPSAAVSTNAFDARIVAVRPAASTRVLTVRLHNDQLLDIRFPELSYLPLRLEVHEPIRIALRREAFVRIEPITD
jgi:molybdate transport system ATP-binding protein